MSKVYSIPGLSPQQWPIETSDRKHVIEVFGPASEVDRNLVYVIIPWKCNITHLQVHKKVAESSQRIYNAFWDRIGRDQSFVNAHHLNQCDGCYNPRPNANNPSIPSLHTWAVAQDWAAAWNPNGRMWSGSSSEIPIEFAECFLAEGWTWLSGKYGTADSMHFQATKNGHPDAPSTADARPALKLGDTGPYVVELQTRLGITRSGTVDDATYTAILAFQKAHGLQTDGIVGPDTWAALTPVAPPIVVPSPMPPVVLPPVVLPPAPQLPPATQPPTPFDPVLRDIWQIIVDKSGLKAEIDAKKAEWVSRAAAIAAESAALARDIHDWQPSALLGGPIIVTPAPLPPIEIPPPPTQLPPPGTQIPSTELSPGEIATITALAASSPVAHYNWKDRGVAPIGYLKGMCVTFGLLCKKYMAGDSAVHVMAQENTGNDDKDALSWYNSNFHALGMSNDVAGLDTLRHLFVLELGLGMRESSGNCLEGYDRTVASPTADSAEAGLFQQSHDSFVASSELPKLMAAYTANPSWGYQKIFLEGVSGAWTQSVGDGQGAIFQRLCKASPAFAVECCAVGLRVIGGQAPHGHWGPIRRKEAELLPAADDLFSQVQQLVTQQEGLTLVTRQEGLPMASTITTPTPVTVPVAVEPATKSKINVTAGLIIFANIMTYLSGGKLDLTGLGLSTDQQVAAMSIINTLGPLLIGYFRTFMTTTITPSSLPALKKSP